MALGRQGERQSELRSRPLAWCSWRWSPRCPAGPDWSGGQNGQADLGTVAEWGDGFQGHVAGALDGPFIGLLEQQRADQAGDDRSHDVADQAGF